MNNPTTPKESQSTSDRVREEFKMWMASFVATDSDRTLAIFRGGHQSRQPEVDRLQSALEEGQEKVRQLIKAVKAAYPVEFNSSDETRIYALQNLRELLSTLDKKGSEERK